MPITQRLATIVFITLLLWSGSNSDFNNFLEFYNAHTTELLQKGLKFRDKIIQFKIHVFIGDAPARSKVCKTTQFNGKFGCLTCLHPTTHPTTKTVNPYKENILIRTNEIYTKQVSICLKNKAPYEGVKDQAFLSNWLDIPECVIIDYMHLSLIGAFKQMFNNFFNSTNHKEPYYLGCYSV